MIKILFLILILLINPVNAITELNNSISADIQSNKFYIVDNQYILNSSDSLTAIHINYDIKTNTNQNIIFIFKDLQNNTLKINYNYTYKFYVYGLYSKIDLYITGSYNNKILKLYSNSVYTGKNVTSIYRSYINWNPFNTYDNFDSVIYFSLKNLKILSGYTKIQNDFYIKNIYISNYSNVNYKYINIDYQDNTINILKNNIENSYNKINIVFQLVYIIFSGILKFFNYFSVGYIISDITLLEYQIYILIPLTYVDYIISLFFNILKFISIMGITWIFIICESLIFIINYGKEKDILLCLDNTFKDSKNFWDIMIVKPLIWIYENLFIKILRG